MAPANQTILLCSPNDVMDFVGIPGVQLRIDDDNLATGQTVTVAVDAALDDTTLQVNPLTNPILKGEKLQFGGGGTSDFVEVTLSATARTGATSLSVNAISGAILALAEAVDNGVNVAWALRLPKACNYGTAEVLRWCLPRYNATALATSWTANDYATALSSEWICSRMLRAVPETIIKRCERVREELKLVRTGTINIENIPTRSISGMPFMDNTTVDCSYYTHKTRLEQTISDNVPSQNIQYIDYGDAYLLQY